MKKFAALLLAFVGVLAITGCSSSVQSLTLTQASGAVELTPVDLNSAGDAGDMTAFETPILKDGESFGSLLGTMTKVSALEQGLNQNREERLLTAVFDLPDGQISVQGLSYYVPSEAVLPEGKPMTRAIVGGTGAYFGITGEVETTRNADDSYTHHLRFTK